MELPIIDRYRSALLGLAAGNALGTTLEFSSPGSFEAIEDMIGGGPLRLKPGGWTDDTSMALCLAASLMATPNKSFLDWGEILDDQARATGILDWLLHQTTKINFKGESCGLKEKRKRGLFGQPNRTEENEREVMSAK